MSKFKVGDIVECVEPVEDLVRGKRYRVSAVNGYPPSMIDVEGHRVEGRPPHAYFAHRFVLVAHGFKEGDIITPEWDLTFVGQPDNVAFKAGVGYEVKKIWANGDIELVDEEGDRHMIGCGLDEFDWAAYFTHYTPPEEEAVEPLMSDKGARLVCLEGCPGQLTVGKTYVSEGTRYAGAVDVTCDDGIRRSWLLSRFGWAKPTAERRIVSVTVNFDDGSVETINPSKSIFD
jgi:hypothetical protein